jgi:hypothetical protein
MLSPKFKEPKMLANSPVVEMLACLLSRVIHDCHCFGSCFYPQQAMSEPITTSLSLCYVAKSPCAQPQEIGKEIMMLLKKKMLFYPSTSLSC